jgi:hypothetical protein
VVAVVNAKETGVQTPRTLIEAHDLLGRLRPPSTAPRQARIAFYRRSAAIYAEIAEIDRGHHHEALYWASTPAALRDLGGVAC